MADKKTFTIEINGLEKAYDNVIKLRDAIKQLDDIKLKIDGNVTIVTNNIKQSLGSLSQANLVLEQSFTELTSTINENTVATNSNSKASEAKQDSIAGLKKILEDLQKQYENLSEVERNSNKGAELAKKIKETEKELEAIDRRVKSHLDMLGELGAKFDTLSDELADLKGTANDLFTVFSNAASVMKTFGIESDAVKSIVGNLIEITKTFNAIQAIQTSLISKDSVITKTAALAKNLYTTAIKGSSVALKGFKLALASTGIGAILVLVGALITNFDSIKESVAEAVGGFERFDKIMGEIEPVIAGVGNVLIQILLAPIKQIINAVNGLIDVISIFKNKGLNGFSDAVKSVENTAKKSVQITKDSYNIIGNYQKEATKKTLSIEAAKQKKLLEADAKLKSDFIKNSEAKYGAAWKFTKEGNAAYQSHFATLELLYKDDKEAYAQLMRDKDIYNREYDDANKSKGSTGPKRDYKQELKDYEKHLKEVKDQTLEYNTSAEEKEIEHQKKMANLAMNGKNIEAKKKVVTELKSVLDKQTADQQEVFDKQLADLDKKAEEEKTKYKDNAKKLEEVTKETEKKRTALIKQQGDERSALIKKQELEVNLEIKRQAVEEMQKIQEKEAALREDTYTKELKDFDSKVAEELEKYKENESRKAELSKAFAEQRNALIAEQDKDRRDQKEQQNEDLLAIDQKYKEDYINNQLDLIAAEENLANASKAITEATKQDMFERNALGLINVGATRENYAKLIEADNKYLVELKANHDQKVQFLNEQMQAAEGNVDLQNKIKEELVKQNTDYQKSVKDTEDKINAIKEESKNTQLKSFEDLNKQLTDKWGQISQIMGEAVKAMGSIFDEQIKDIKEKQEEVNKQYDAVVEKRKTSEDKLKLLEEEAKTASGGRAMVVQEQIARQMEANNDLAKQEKDLAKQKEKLEKEAAKKEKQKKKMELAQNFITGVANVALGVTKALAEGPILGKILAIATAAAGAVQTGIIASQLAKLEDGGLLNGKRHSQGGMRIEGTNIEVEGDEFVVNRVSTNKNLGLIDYINKNRKELTPTDINSYFVRSGRSNNKQDIAVAGRRMYEQGGVLTNLEAVDTISAPSNDLILDAISKINFKPVVSVVDITSAQDNLSEVKDIAGA